MPKRKRTNAFLLCDFDDYRPSEGELVTYGIVRCPDGDWAAWTDLSAQVLDWAGADDDEELERPVWGWWRWNPDGSGEYGMILAPANGPGRGNWRGAKVIVKAVPR